MTTTKLIELLRQYEFGRATGSPREISFSIEGIFIPSPNISIGSAGDGLFAELCLALSESDEDTA